MHVNPYNSNRPDNNDTTYSKVISKINKDGVCPFCREHISKYHKNPILYEGKFWILTDNMYPYQNTKYHFLLIHKDHIENFSEITTDSWLELQDICKLEINNRKIAGGSFFMRFGDTQYTGATVSHLHAHIVSRDLNTNSKNPILARLG